MKGNEIEWKRVKERGGWVNNSEKMKKWRKKKRNGTTAGSSVGLGGVKVKKNINKPQACS